jgi:transposase
MAKSYSSDLRKRVIDFIEAGHSRRQAARRFDVSVSFAVKLMARWRKSGSLAPGRRGRPRGGGKLAPHRGFVIGRVEAKPDITMPELAAELEAERGLRVSPASLSRLLCQAGFSYKKNPDGRRARTLRHRQGAAHVDRAPAAAHAP